MTKSGFNAVIEVEAMKKIIEQAYALMKSEWQPGTS